MTCQSDLCSTRPSPGVYGKKINLCMKGICFGKKNLHDMVPYSYTPFEIPIQVGKRLYISTNLRSFIAGQFEHSKSPK
jgi:hypothetical protein